MPILSTETDKSIGTFDRHSLGLVKGSLDQVSATAKITWVQPRVLTRQQIEALKGKLDEWTTRVIKVGEYAHAHGGSDILV